MYQSGSILAFSGDWLQWYPPWVTVSATIKARFCHWCSHVGLVVQITRDDVEAAKAADALRHLDFRRIAYLLDHPPGVCCLESTMLLANTPCLATGQPISGVQCTRIDDRIAAYKGRVAVMRPLKALAEPQRAVLARLALQQCGTRYDTSGAALIGTVLWKYLRGFRAADRSSLFCSELVEANLDRIGLGNPRLKPGFASPKAVVQWHQGETHHLPEWET